MAAAPTIAPLNPYNFTPKPQIQPNTQPSINLGLNQTFSGSNKTTVLNDTNTTFKKPTVAPYASTPNYTLNTPSYGQLQTNPSQSLLPQTPNYINKSQASVLQPLNSNKAINNRDAKPSGLTAQEIMDFLN